MAARHSLAAFLRDESGATAIEYGVIISLIFLVVVSSFTYFAGNFTLVMDKISTAVGGAMGGN
ncbi:MAG: Flp family type IVb pilin [Caulobacterales bacterium]|nr:Flp family type IVb pilin [Caulobacterales bacterium]